MTETALWYKKHKPDDLSGFVWCNEQLRDKVLEWIENPSSMPHIILEGPPGTGKTTLSELIIGHLKLDALDYLFLSTNKHSGVDSIKENITEFCELLGWSDIRVVVIDEADGLSGPAQDKLRAVINDHGDNVRFIFTCNKIGSLTSALKSRARVYSVNTLNFKTFGDKIADILAEEKIEIKSDDALVRLINDTFPDLRKAIDLLQDSCSPKEGGGYTFSYVGNQGNTGKSWEIAVRECLIGGGIRTLRDIITGMPKSEQEEVYKFLYENSNELFGSQEMEQMAIVLIANYLKDHDKVAFPEINMLAMFCELIELTKEK